MAISMAGLVHADDAVYAIDLPTALRLAKAENNRIKVARERITEAEARLDKAKLSLIPDLSIGASIYRHDGPLQETNGKILDINRSASQAGLGAGATGAGNATVPGISIQTDLADTFFDPLAAKQNLTAVRADLLDQRLDTLLNVAHAYYELLRAKSHFAVAQESLQNANELYNTTSSFAQSGEGLESDVARAAVEQLVYQRNMERARESALVNSIELARLLRLDPTTQLEPHANRAVPVDFVANCDSVSALIVTALENHPSIERESALVSVASTQLRKAENAVLIPSVAVSSSLGTFLGGQGSTLNSSGDRADINAVVYWELQNFGLGDRADTKMQRSILNQQMVEELDAMDRLAAEVATARAMVVSRSRQVDIGERAIERGRTAYQLNRTRIFENQGLPVEALQAISALDVAGRLYVDAVIDYNKAQYSLFTALGQPCTDTVDVEEIIIRVEEQTAPMAASRPITAQPVETETKSNQTTGIFSKIFQPKSKSVD